MENWQSRTNNYGNSSGNVKARWLGYEEYSVPPFDFEKEIISRIPRKGDETILDVGCSDGSVLFDLKHRFAHQGRLLGIDPNSQQFSASEFDPGMEGIELLELSLEEAEFPANFADIITSFFMFYYIAEKDQPAVIEKLKKWLKNDGLLIVSTSGEENKIVHRFFESEMAAAANVKPPQRMNQAFTSERADDFLPEYFNCVAKIEHHAYMEFTEMEDARIYILSLMSMQNEFDPTPPARELFAAIDERVKPVIERSIELYGKFQDKIVRDYYLCSDKAMPWLENDPMVVWLNKRATLLTSDSTLTG